MPDSFQLPSGNIGCDVYRSSPDGSDPSLDCQVIKHDFTPEQSPHGAGTCVGATLTSGGKASVSCPSDVRRWIGKAHGMPVEDGSGPLETAAYGMTYTTGKQACSVTEQGLTCWNADSAHGFAMSRQRLDVW